MHELLDKSTSNRCGTRARNSALAALLLAVAINATALAVPKTRGRDGVRCDDSCLTQVMSRYLADLVRHDPTSLHLAKDIDARENAAAVNLGDGSWRTITKVYAGQTYADASTGQVIHLGATEVDGKTGSLFVRLKVIDGKITESEMFTKGGEPGVTDDMSGFREPDVLYDATVPPAQRSTRSELLSIVDHYLDAIGQHDGKRGAFSYRCDRYAAGAKITNSGRAADVGGGTCETSLNGLKGQNPVNRRIALVDVERGLVAVLFIIPHSERPVPGATNNVELCKIVDGKIRSIDEFNFRGKYPPSSGFPDP